MKYITFFCWHKVFEIRRVSQTAQGTSIRTGHPSGAPNHAWPVAVTLDRAAGGELRLLGLPLPPTRPVVPPLIPPKIPEGERVDFDVSKGHPVPRCLCAN